MKRTITALLLLLPVSLSAATIHVFPDGSGEYPTIAAALVAASADDIVELACGTYYEHDLVIPDGVLLRSDSGLASCATIDAQELGRVIDQGHDVELMGLTFTNGLINEMYQSGGGVRLSGPARVTNCDFLGNTIYSGYDPTTSGGGLYADGEIALTNCHFEDNSASRGSGASLRGSCVLSLCSFTTDDGLDVSGAWWESAIFSSCKLMSSVFIDGVDNLTFTDCVLRSHLHLSSPQFLRMESSTMYRGGIEISGEYLLIMDHCILFDVFGGSFQTRDASFLLTCNDLFGGSLPEELTSQIGQNANFSSDPLFCDPQGGLYSLHSDSPCTPANSPCGSLVGAFPAGCGTTSTEARSWSSIKALY